MEKINFNAGPSTTYSISIVVKDSLGNYKGRREFHTNSAAELASIYNKYAWRDTKKRKKKESQKSE